MRTSHHSSGSNRLIRSAVSAILALGAVHAGVVRAQAENATGADGPAAGHEDSSSLQEVVVTGYRSSLEQAGVKKGLPATFKRAIAVLKCTDER